MYHICKFSRQYTGNDNGYGQFDTEDEAIKAAIILFEKNKYIQYDIFDCELKVKTSTVCIVDGGIYKVNLFSYDGKMIAEYGMK